MVANLGPRSKKQEDHSDWHPRLLPMPFVSVVLRQRRHCFKEPPIPVNEGIDEYKARVMMGLIMDTRK
jgi:hypothetical protein